MTVWLPIYIVSHIEHMVYTQTLKFYKACLTGQRIDARSEKPTEAYPRCDETLNRKAQQKSPGRGFFVGRGGEEEKEFCYVCLYNR